MNEKRPFVPGQVAASFSAFTNGQLVLMVVAITFAAQADLFIVQP